MHKGKTAIVAVILSATTMTVFGESLEHKERRKKAQEMYLDGAVRSIATQKQCGFAVDVDVQWDTFKFDDTHSENAAAQMCAVVLSEISFVCRRSADGKAAVQSKIKHVSCGYSDAESTSVNHGTVYAAYGFGALRGYSDRVAKALKGQL